MPNHFPRSLLAAFSLSALLLASCGSESNSTQVVESQPATPAADTEQVDDAPEEKTSEAEAAGLRLVSAEDAADLRDNPPADLVILDVRTQEEYDQGHLEDATLIDFYQADFADLLADLDPDQPYLIYCRSGNRSGQTLALMEQLGFTDVADVDGGILAWQQAGLPIAP